MELPDELRYAKSHEWVRLSGKTATVGITKFAVEQLRDLVFLDLPAVGASVRQGEPFGEIESVKAVSDLVAPVSGTVVRVNAELSDRLETLGADPYRAGWMIEVEVRDPAEVETLLSAGAYRRQAESEHH